MDKNLLRADDLYFNGAKQLVYKMLNPSSSNFAAEKKDVENNEDGFPHMRGSVDYELSILFFTFRQATVTENEVHFIHEAMTKEEDWYYQGMSMRMAYFLALTSGVNSLVTSSWYVDLRNERRYIDVSEKSLIGYVKFPNDVIAKVTVSDPGRIVQYYKQKHDNSIALIDNSISEAYEAAASWDSTEKGMAYSRLSEYFTVEML